MAYGKKGKAPKVKDRWYGDHKYRYERKLKPREFKGVPQFTFDELYITPFTHRRHYSEDGRLSYIPLERSLQPTGIRVMDDFLRSLSAGCTDVTTFCERYGARTNLYFAYQRDLRTTPSDRREQLRQQGDEGRYRIE